MADEEVVVETESPEAEVKPTEEAPTETPAEKPEAAKPEWDKKLQQEQQQRANAERRAAKLQQELETLKTQAEAKPTEDDDPIATLNSLKEKAKQYDKAMGELEVIRQRMAYDEFLGQMNNEFADFGGGNLRNPALEYARQKALDAGYTLSDTDHPSYEQTTEWIRLGYLNAAKRGLKPAESKPEVKPRVDTGKGGKPVGTKGDFKGKPADVLADMKAKGKFARMLQDS